MRVELRKWTHAGPKLVRDRRSACRHCNAYQSPQAVAERAREVPDPNVDDDHIRNHIIASIEKADCGPLGRGVTVRNGHVHLSGIISNERFREAAIVAAEDVSGVTRVHDHLSWVEPMSGAYLNSREDEARLKAN